MIVKHYVGEKRRAFVFVDDLDQMREAHRQGLEYFKAWYASDPERQVRTTDEVIAEWSATSSGRQERRVAHQPARASNA